ncbi:MAG: AraC family transcriptional regulator [Pseudomonadota bacterium]
MDINRTMAHFDTSQVFFHDTDPQASPWPYTVPVGGRTAVSHKDGMVRRRFHEHTFIFTLSGEGRIEAGDHIVRAGPNSVVWLDTALRYGHGAQSGAPWVYLWFAMSGPGLGQLHERMALLDLPVTEDIGTLRMRFEAVVATLADHPEAADAILNAQVAAILTEVFARRQGDRDMSRNDPILQLMRQVRREIDLTWEVEDMASLVALSPSQLFRRFKDATGTSPISWLRHERMLLARHFLTGTTERIASIALRCGYRDPFHFSRDFKRLTGCSPKDYRSSSR